MSLIGIADARLANRVQIVCCFHVFNSLAHIQLTGWPPLNHTTNEKLS